MPANLSLGSAHITQPFGEVTISLVPTEVPEILRLSVVGRSYGVPFEGNVQFQADGGGKVVVRIHETSDHCRALVLTDAGQVYPAP